MNIHSHRDRPDLADQFETMEAGAFPEFMLADAIWNEHFPRVLDAFPDHQWYLVDDELAAVFNAVPVAWDGSVDDLPGSEHDILIRGLREHDEGKAPTALFGIQIAVAESHAGQGLPSMLTEHGLAACRREGLSGVIFPLRPTLKHRYPTIPFERYVEWTRPDGQPFDPWIRTHERAGADRLGLTREPMRFEGTVAQWEEWTGLALPESGDYAIDGAVDLLHIDVDADLGRLDESNVWYRYPADGES